MNRCELQERGRRGRALFLCGVRRRRRVLVRRASRAHRAQHATRRGRRSTWSTCRPRQLRASWRHRVARRVDGGPARCRSAPISRRWSAQYSIEDGRIRFTPMFPLDPGRQYHVTFTPPGARADHRDGRLCPRRTRRRRRRSRRCFRRRRSCPENQLRLYIHFSAPMGSRGGLDFVHLLDEAGQEVDGSVPAARRRVLERRSHALHGVLRSGPPEARHRADRRHGPLADGGQVVHAGGRRRVARRQWLAAEAAVSAARSRSVRRTSGRSIRRRGRSTRRPPARSAPLTVAFPEPLDHGLLLRALGVLAPDGKPLEGEVVVGASELTWAFTPPSRGRPARYNIVAFAMLEDLAGNRIGRAFEVDQFDRTDKSGEPEKTLIPFVVKPVTDLRQDSRSWTPRALPSLTCLSALMLLQQREHRPAGGRDALRVAFLIRRASSFPASCRRAVCCETMIFLPVRDRFLQFLGAIRRSREARLGFERAEREHRHRGVEHLRRGGDVRSPSAASGDWPLRRMLRQLRRRFSAITSLDELQRENRRRRIEDVLGRRARESTGRPGRS